MTAHHEMDGGVSIRVVVGIGGGTVKHDLLELIISAENVGELCSVLACGGTGITGGGDLRPSFPCHIGFCRDAVSSAA
jgi:hypothetical protein